MDAAPWGFKCLNCSVWHYLNAVKRNVEGKVARLGKLVKARWRGIQMAVARLIRRVEHRSLKPDLFGDVHTYVVDHVK